MISCTEFIPLYSVLFSYLEEKGGHNEVLKYWNFISDELTSKQLGEKVSEKGIKGCWEYWSKSLNEEACDFVMELDETEGVFSIDMKACPSRGRLNSFTHMDKYHDYCGHCAVVYARQLEKYGIYMNVCDLSRVENAECYLSFKCDKKNPYGEKLQMVRNASDNEYFHQDFHLSGDFGIKYIGENFGDEEVKEYLTKFTKEYFKPLIEKVRKNGIREIKNHIEKTYEIEKVLQNVECTIENEELRVKVSSCPAVTYMKEQGYEISKWYIETTATVNKVLAEESGLKFSLISYNTENGAAEYVFQKK